ncbi:MAG: cellulase family glycosylhydrolase [Pirellulales bacterium]
MRHPGALLLLFFLTATCFDHASGEWPPIAIHPDNPKYFLFRGRPLVLLSATEHYGSVVNRAFDFERYLADAADKKQTLTRTFLLFREQQSSRNPSSPLKAESPDYLAPYPRMGPERAMDGEPQYDLDSWNGEYFARLHKFLTRASELGIVVELTLFSNSYGPDVWALNPLRADNNMQKVGRVAWQEYTSLKDPDLNKRQFAFAAKIVEETSRYDNVYYEICNEPGGGIAGHATPEEVDAWQAEIARVIRETLKRLGRKHLVFGSRSFDYARHVTQPLDATFAGTMVDVVNVHPLPNVVLGGRTYMLGRFMSKDLALEDFAAFCRATQGQAKPCVLDEDNAATLYRDAVGWTIHRKRAWIALLSQTHYDMIDFSITVGSESGTRESSAQLRTWMKHLSEFVHALDFLHARPVADFFEPAPQHLVTAAMAVPGKRWVAYLADAREVTDPAAGEPISGSIAFRLPQGDYLASLFSPTTGLYSPAVTVRGGSEPVTLELPEFRHDVVVDVRRP